MTEEFSDLGSQSVKNITRPIRVWQWTLQIREQYSGARFVTLPGNNHALVPETPAYDKFIGEFHRFVDEHGPDSDTSDDFPGDS